MSELKLRSAIRIAQFSVCCFVFCSSLFAQSWEKTYPGYRGLGGSVGNAICETSDNGFIIAGSANGGVGANKVYLVKTDVNGDTIWTKYFGEDLASDAGSVEQTPDGGYIIGGVATRLLNGIGDIDIFLIKTDPNGNLLWRKYFGGAEQEFFGSVVQTSDGGYCIAGSTGYVISRNSDVYLIKTDGNGNTAWSKKIGGGKNDFAFSLQQTADGGYIISGTTDRGIANISTYGYLIKTDHNGDTLWTRSVFTSGREGGRSILLTNDGGYLIGGDHVYAYAEKTDANGNIQWWKGLGGGMYQCNSVIKSDDGYILGGSAYNNDAVIVKLDFNGAMVWSKNFGSINSGNCSMVQPAGNGFIAVGYSRFDIAHFASVHAIKIDCKNFPSVNISVADTICQGNSVGVTLRSDLSSGVAYQWIKNNADVPDAVSSSFIANAGYHKLRVTDLNGCSNESNSVNVNFPEPQFTLYPAEVCPGGKVQTIKNRFSISTNYDNPYEWDFGDGTKDTAYMPIHIYQDTGTYKITRTLLAPFGRCISSSNSVKITPFAIPPVDFDLLVNSKNVYPNRACPLDTIEVVLYKYTYMSVPLPPFEPTSFFWDFGDGTTDTAKYPVHFYQNNGTYTIGLTVTNGCGNSNYKSTVITINSNFCNIASIGRDEYPETALLFPNPFSESTTLSIPHQHTSPCTFAIYDVLGKEVRRLENITAESTTIEKGNLEGGIYFYKLTDQRDQIISAGKMAIR